MMTQALKPFVGYIVSVFGLKCLLCVNVGFISDLYRNEADSCALNVRPANIFWTFPSYLEVSLKDYFLFSLKFLSFLSFIIIFWVNSFSSKKKKTEAFWLFKNRIAMTISCSFFRCIKRNWDRSLNWLSKMILLMMKFISQSCQ